MGAAGRGCATRIWRRLTMQLPGVGMGATASTTTAATTTGTTTETIPNTLTAGLSIWANPVAAFEDIPGVFTLLGNSSYTTFAIGALLPVAALALLLVMSMSGGSSSGRRH